MPAGLFDTMYQRLTDETLTKKELLKMNTEMKKVVLFGVNNYSSFDVRLKISEAINADDVVIKVCASDNLISYDDVTNLSKTYLILDNGSKELFDDLWENGFDNKNLTHKFWRSKHCSKEQLMDIYNNQIKKSDNKFTAERAKSDFLQHQNVPEKIMNL